MLALNCRAVSYPGSDIIERNFDQQRRNHLESKPYQAPRFMVRTCGALPYLVHKKGEKSDRALVGTIAHATAHTFVRSIEEVHHALRGVSAPCFGRRLQAYIPGIRYMYVYLFTTVDMVRRTTNCFEEKKAKSSEIEFLLQPYIFQAWCNTTGTSDTAIARALRESVGFIVAQCGCTFTASNHVPHFVC